MHVLPVVRRWTMPVTPSATNNENDYNLAAPPTECACRKANDLQRRPPHLLSRAASDRFGPLRAALSRYEFV